MGAGGSMEMGYAVTLLLLAAFTGVAFAQDANASDANATAVQAMSAAIEVRMDIVTLGYMKTTAAMNSTIDFLQGKGKDVSGLAALNDNFTALYGGLQQYVNSGNPSGFGKQVADMHKVAARFKSETARLAEPGQMGELKRLILNKTTEVDEDENFSSMAGRMLEKKRVVYEKICGVNIQRIEGFIANASGLNVSVDDLQRGLSEMRGKCANANATLNESVLRGIKERVNASFRECNLTEEQVGTSIRERLMAANVTINDEVSEKLDDLSGLIMDRCKKGLPMDSGIEAKVNAMLRKAEKSHDNGKDEEIKKRFENAGAAVSITARAISERGLDRAIAVVSALENKGMNVSGVAEKLRELKDLKGTVQTACIGNGTSEACRAAIKGFTEEVNKIGERVSVISPTINNGTKARIGQGIAKKLGGE